MTRLVPQARPLQAPSDPPNALHLIFILWVGHNILRHASHGFVLSMSSCLPGRRRGEEQGKSCMPPEQTTMRNPHSEPSPG